MLVCMTKNDLYQGEISRASYHFYVELRSGFDFLRTHKSKRMNMPTSDLPPEFQAPSSESPFQAEQVFERLIKRYEPLQPAQPYKKVTLVRLTYENCLAKDAFLRQFFVFFKLTSYGEPSPLISLHTPATAIERLLSFADHLFDNFYLLSMSHPGW